MKYKFKVGDKVTYTDSVKKRNGLGFEIMTVEWIGVDYKFFEYDYHNYTQCTGDVIVVTDIDKRQWDYPRSLRLVSPLEELL